MLQEAKKLFLAGVGAAAVTYDKASEVIEQLVEKGKITVDEGKELSEELKREIKEKAEDVRSKANEKIEDMKPLTRCDVSELLKQFNFATKDEVLELKNRISELELKLQEKE